MTQTDYVIMAGGTGGHIFPAMAVAKSLMARGASVSWLGTSTGMEARLVPATDIVLHIIKIKGFRGKKLISKLMMPFLLIIAVWQSIQVLRKVKPKVVVGFGGYVAAPGGIAARILGKKLIIHEQNSVAGSTNKLLSRLAHKSLEAFPASLNSATLVGNPVRDSIKALHNKTIQLNDIQTAKKLLIMGGSLGAEAINAIVPQVLHALPREDRPEIWHQAGKGKHQTVIDAYQQYGINARTVEFIESVEEAYEWADIIICRAGALTVSEVAVVGLPAIFIPYPYAIDNHQFTNAQWLVDNQAAFSIEQSELSVESLTEKLTLLLSNTQILQQFSHNLKQLAMPDATEKVVAICEGIYSGEIKNAA